MTLEATVSPASITPQQAVGLGSLLTFLSLVIGAWALYLWQRRRLAERHAAQLDSLNAALRQSERALRHSEERFRHAFEDGPVGILIAQPNTRILRANRALCALLGYSENALHGLGLYDLALPEDARQHLDDVKRVIAGEAASCAHELRFVTRTRELLWAKVTTSLVFDPDRKPLYELSIVEDITDRKRSEESLRQLEERFSKAFHSSPVPIAILTLAEGRFIEVNECFLRLVGHPREALIGHSTQEFGLWPDPVERQRLAESLQSQQSMRDVEVHLTTRDGKTRECLAALETIELGRERCLLSILHDVTERQQTEHQLRRSQERFELIARATNDTVWDHDLTTNRVWWNEAIRTVFGHTHTPLEEDADWWDQQIHPEDRHRVLAGMRDAIEQGEQSWSAEYRFRRGDGVYADVFDRAYVLHDGEGHPIRMIGAIMDITERKRFLSELARARDAAVEALRLKSEFLANISHEVRTPLNGIVGMTLLLQDSQLSHEQRSYVDTVQSSTDALLTVINDLLDFSKMEAGKVHFEQLDFELRPTVDSTIEILADRAQSKHIELVTLVEPDVPDRLRGDPGRLRQVITNLVVNAIKFTEQGEVVLRVSRSTETDTHVVLLFTVRDTGIGIPKEALPYLFQAFSQVDGSTTRKHGGTGLGLTISKQLVELMGGQIGVESRAGQGSTFWFTLRLEKQPARAPAETTAPPNLAAYRVLVAANHESSRQALLTATTTLGIEAAATNSGEQALHLLREAAGAGKPFQLAVLDMGLRDLDGLNLARTVRGDPLLNKLRLLLLAPRGPQPDTAFLRASGIGALLTKPVRQKLLIESIARLLTPDIQHETRLWLDRRPIQRAPLVIPGGDRHCRILVAEDNPINQRVALALLEKLGYKAQAVATGPEVLRATERVAYDIILMDCQLPEIDGFETTRELRRREPSSPSAAAHKPYIIAMTAMAQPGARERCLAAGMNDYLSKPVRIEALTSVLRTALDQLPSLPRLVLDAPPQLPRTPVPADRAVDPAALDALAALRSAGRPDPVGEMVGMFLRQAPACLREVELGIIRYDAREVERAAHSLKGSASTLGAHRLADLCFELETEAGKGSLQVATRLLNGLRVEFSRVRDELQPLVPPA